MAKTYPLKDIIRKAVKAIAFLGVLYLLAVGAMLACAATTRSYYDDIRLDERLDALLDRRPQLATRDIGVAAAVAAIPPAALPERTGTVGGIRAARGVELYFLDPLFNITVILDDHDRILIKHPSFEGGA